MAELQTYNARPIGVAPDLSPPNCPPEFYNAGRNIFFQEDRARRIAGFTYRTPKPLFRPEALQYRRFAGTDQWLYAGPDGIGLDVGTQTDITPIGFPVDMEPGQHGWTSLNDVPVYNHRGFTPHFHDGLLLMLEIPGWPAGWFANRIVAFKFFLMALGGGDGVTENNQQIRWSSSADPGNLPSDWIPAPDNDAGDLVIGEPEGAIIDAVPLRDQLVVYKTTSTHVLQFIGGTFIFAQRTIFPRTGILTDRCAVEYRGRHFVVTEGDIIMHDGVRAQSIADGAVRNAIFDNIAGALLPRAFAYIDPEELSFCFCYPSREAAGWCDTRARYNLGSGPDAGRWSFERLGPDELSDIGVGRYTVSGLGGDWDSDPYAWDLKPGTWNDTAFENVGDQTIESIHDAAEFGQPRIGGKRGELIPVAELVWSSKQLTPGRAILVDHLWPIIQNPGSSELFVQVGTQDDYNAPIDWRPEQRLDVARGVDVGLRCRYFSVRIRIEAESDWTLAGFDIDYRDAGRW